MPQGFVKEVGERGALMYRVDSQLALFGGRRGSEEARTKFAAMAGCLEFKFDERGIEQ